MENNKPRVRRPRIGGASSQNDRRSFGENRGYGEKRSYGEGRGERRSYGEGRSEGRSYGEGRGNNRGFGGRSNEGRGGFGGGRNSFGGHSEGRNSFGGHSEGRNSFGGHSEGRSYTSRGEGRSYGEGHGYNRGEGRSEGRSYSSRGEGRSSFGGHSEGFRGGRSEGYNSRGEGFKGGNRGGFSKGRGAAGSFKKPNHMQAMLAKKLENDSQRFSDSDVVTPEAKDVIRLNKFIANSGVCSRREADDLILAGVVSVNGVVVNELGTKVNIFTDEIRYDGQLLRGEQKVYIVMNKPTGFVTTMKDPHAERTVMDLIKDCPHRVFPVGRLDKQTTGVLMLTNDGEIAERLTHPSYDKKKIYQVGLDRPLSDLDYEQIVAGLTLEDGLIEVDDLQYIDDKDHRKLGIEIHSGKNRIVRRIFESLGYKVKSLDRVYFAGLTKKNIKKGEWRYLTEAEINILRMGAYL